MGDRNNPIKFGPEWLRNLSRERSAATSTSNGNTNSPNAATNAATSTSPGTSGPSGGGGTTPTNLMQGNTFNNTNAPSKILLAKLRYGREEMLALYDRNSEAPPELKTIDMLYQPRGKPPSALNSTFDEERDNLRSVPPAGGLSLGERFILGRGVGRGQAPVEGRGRGRGLFVRQQSIGRGSSWHTGNPRMPGYSGGADEESAPPIRSWSNNTGPNPSNTRSTTETAEWLATKMFRKRPGSSTNWRQSTRDEGDEWRSDLGRSRPQQDKWERDWGERAAQDKQSSWNSNRRTWGGDTNDENLPEWAMDGSEACGGTFDSSGAFHGYSNDDSNLPKSQESPYPLTRSHTHGSCVRQKTVEEGSEEWWASEKAKKLSPKRFDAGDIKFKKTPSVGISETSNNVSATANKSTGNKDDHQDILQKDLDSNSGSPNSPQSFASAQDSIAKSKFTESKTFDALMRSDINLEEASDERGNFQSVMITPNNSLRQKHQNIVSPVNEAPSKRNRKPGMLRVPRSASNPSAECPLEKAHKTPEDKIVEDIFDLALEDKEMMPNLPNVTNNSLLIVSNASSTAHEQGMPTVSQSRPQLLNPMQMGLSNTMLSNQGMSLNQNNKSSIPAQGMQSTGLQSMQPVGITNSALNASLGLPLGGTNMGIPLQGVPAPVLPSPRMATPGMNTPGLGTPTLNTSGLGTPRLIAPGMSSSGRGTIGIGSPGMGTSGLSTSALQAGISAVGMQGGSSGMAGFSSTALSGMSTNSNVANNSLFMGQNTGNSTLQSPNDIQMPNHSGASSFFQLHALQHSGSQNAFGNSIYSNMMQQTPRQAAPSAQSLSDQWYYEDPKKIIQGPFSSKDMFNWYIAGFFSPTLMVRRVCDSVMRPLGSYGPIVPFASQLDMMPYQMCSAPHDNMLNSQQSLGLDVMNMQNMSLTDNNSVDPIQFGSVGMMCNPPYGQAPMMESLWGQPATSADLMWMQHAMNSRNENRVNNLPMFFWDQQPSAIASNSLLPEEIVKEMKTEDQILAQLKANQNMGSQQTLPFITDQSATTPTTTKSDDNFTLTVNATPNLEELQKLIQKDALVSPPLPASPVSTVSPASPTVSNERDVPEEPKSESPKPVKPEPAPVEPKPQSTPTKSAENKANKQAKSDNEKTAKSKETTSKSKSKKAKEEKKDEPIELKNKDKEKEKDKEEDKKAEPKRSAEPSPSKSKKEEKSSKKELDKEKKEWIKEGFTLVKGAEKTVSKESKKKAEEIKVAEEAERKRREEEKQAAEQEKKKKQADTIKKQQELQQQQQRQAVESAIKKAPWSTANNQVMQAMNKDGLTLAEIQRLEREKKVEQIKEQQQMMHIIAQQQAAALAREQEMQAGLGWAKKKNNSTTTPGQSLAEIQAEARKQAAAAAAAVAAAAAAQALEEAQAPPPLPINNVPWGSSHNGSGGGGFWDTLPNQPIKPEKNQESPKITEASKNKKKPQPVVTIPAKKEVSPAADFDNWCTVVLTSWSSKIDVPTFVGFLKDIESPYEVKDYVKCYLGETKESSDFARQFLERRSKLLRVGMVTPSDDLCSPAMAINPRTISGSDYQEVKGKGKKTKKNKMLKIDARILGFSVTAAEDRINVGDIDTA